MSSTAMQTNTLKFDVSELLRKTTGSRDLYSFEGPISFEGIKTNSDIKGKLEIMRIDEGVNAKVTDVEVKVTFICSRCLKTFTQKIVIDMAERQFLLDKPEKSEDINDLFLIDRKNLDIDLVEPLRQEIILHFPLIPVCSKGCKGICSICGKDRNKEECKCKEQIEPTGNKPLSDLKKLYYG